MGSHAWDKSQQQMLTSKTRLSLLSIPLLPSLLLPSSGSSLLWLCRIWRWTCPLFLGEPIPPEEVEVVAIEPEKRVQRHGTGNCPCSLAWGSLYSILPIRRWDLTGPGKDAHPRQWISSSQDSHASVLQGRLQAWEGNINSYSIGS